LLKAIPVALTCVWWTLDEACIIAEGYSCCVNLCLLKTWVVEPEWLKIWVAEKLIADIFVAENRLLNIGS
jgi:hypothetical protein